MPDLATALAEHTDIAADDRRWLAAMVREWSLLADTSFSDLVLWLLDSDGSVFWASAEQRPNTGQTTLEHSVVGNVIPFASSLAITDAYVSGQIVVQRGFDLMAEAVPIIRNGRTLAVVELRSSHNHSRISSALDDYFIDTSRVLIDMLWRGVFPIEPPSDPPGSPGVPDGVIRTDNYGVVLFAEPKAIASYRRLGYVGDLEGCKLLELSETLGRLKTTVKGPEDAFGNRPREVYVESADAAVRLRVIPLSHAREPLGELVLCIDVTALLEHERRLTTKDATIREVHHRVKNNLQTVASLLRLQSRRMSSDEGRAALREAVSRVQSIALVQEILSATYDEMVPFDQVVDQLLFMVGDLASPSGTVTSHREGSFGMVPADAATSLALVVTELCQNAIEHGLGYQSGTLTVTARRNSAQLSVYISNDGAPLPAGFDIADTRSLGLSIVATLVDDLGGTFTLANNVGTPGTVATLELHLE
ncbi:MAG: sensor histidine kinase [Propionibacteriaceae bacterium]|jgi:two-component sensor histidine kinase|nr:sensor histidine kinase [Propionibacteriaceae bacterium]